MRDRVLASFPEALLRQNPDGTWLALNDLAHACLGQLGPEFHREIACRAANEVFTLAAVGRLFNARIFQIAGSTDKLLILYDAAELPNRLPSSVEQSLEDFTSNPAAVAERIAAIIQQVLTFERFDIVRVDQALRKYTYEYSMGVDIAGTLHTAYSAISDSGLGWIFQHEASYLVEELRREDLRFWEDPLLYHSGFRSVLRVPIIFNHSVVGALLLASFEPNHFRVEDAYLLEAIARLIAQPFYHAGILLRQEYQTLANAVLLNTFADLLPNGNLTLFLAHYCQHLQKNSRLARVGIMLIDCGRERRRCIVAAGVELPERTDWTPIGQTGIVAMLRAKSLVSFKLADPRYQDSEEGLSGHGFTGVLYAPVENGKGEIVAALTALSRDEQALSSHVAGIFKAATDQLSFIFSHLQPEAMLVLDTPKSLTSSTPKGFEQIVGTSPAIRETIHRAATAAKYDFPILLTGETGTGKELFARAIHESSPMNKGPFIVVNSAAIPANLLESELFGYQEGTFTGGLKGGKKGKILLADGGTLFLDEIGELSPELQAKILRVIQEQEVEPLGSTKPIPVRVRFISATHRSLSQMVRTGEFREDLFYRLNAIEISLPPLRERGRDVIELAETIMDELARSHGTLPKRFSPETKELLLNYPWPGNVRELQNIVNRLFVFVEGQEIHSFDLPPDIRHARANVPSDEREKMRCLLEEFNGNKTALAHYLGITRTGLWKKLKRLGLQ